MSRTLDELELVLSDMNDDAESDLGAVADARRLVRELREETLPDDAGPWVDLRSAVENVSEHLERAIAHPIPRDESVDAPEAELRQAIRVFEATKYLHGRVCTLLGMHVQ